VTGIRIADRGFRTHRQIVGRLCQTPLAGAHLPVLNPCLLVSCVCGIRRPCSTPQIKSGIESVIRVRTGIIHIIGLCRGIAVAVSEWVSNPGDYASSARRQQHVRLELEVSLLCEGCSVTAGISREPSIKVETCERIRSDARIIGRGLWIRWCSIGDCCECVGYRSSRINSIIRFVTFAGGRHGGDFGFGAGAGAFLASVPDSAEN